MNIELRDTDRLEKNRWNKITSSYTSWLTLAGYLAILVVLISCFCIAQVLDYNYFLSYVEWKMTIGSRQIPIYLFFYSTNVKNVAMYQYIASCTDTYTKPCFFLVFSGDLPLKQSRCWVMILFLPFLLVRPRCFVQLYGAYLLSSGECVPGVTGVPEPWSQWYLCPISDLTVDPATQTSGVGAWQYTPKSEPMGRAGVALSLSLSPAHEGTLFPPFFLFYSIVILKLGYKIDNPPLAPTEFQPPFRFSSKISQ